MYSDILFAFFKFPNFVEARCKKGQWTFIVDEDKFMPRRLQL